MYEIMKSLFIKIAASVLFFNKLILDSMCTSTAGLCPALENGIAAEMYVKDGRLADALRLYEAAISELLKGTNGEPPGERRLLLLDKVCTRRLNKLFN